MREVSIKLSLVPTSNVNSLVQYTQLHSQCRKTIHAVSHVERAMYTMYPTLDPGKVDRHSTAVHYVDRCKVRKWQPAEVFELFYATVLFFGRKKATHRKFSEKISGFLPKNENLKATYLSAQKELVAHLWPCYSAWQKFNIFSWKTKISFFFMTNCWSKKIKFRKSFQSSCNDASYCLKKWNKFG